MVSERRVLVGVDMGAGRGAKIGLFDNQEALLAEALLPQTEYGDTPESLATNLAECIERLIHSSDAPRDELASVGVASPGLFRSDGSYMLAANLDFLDDANLPALLRERLGVPIGIENDANCGGLAEWSVLRTELHYWVFGGGWGGAWISADGDVRFPAVDWGGDDRDLHFTDEPGYAIPISKVAIRSYFMEVGVSYEHFDDILIEEFDPPDSVMTGPGGSPDHLRAELILSGPGRCRLFRAVVGDDDFYERFLDIHEVNQMNDPAVAGQHISKLSSMRVEAAVNSDRLFGKILADATRTLLKQARRDKCREGVPICLGGKPSYALPYFGPSAQRLIGKMGFMNYLRPSVLDERGSNANLVGAHVVARKALDAEGTR